MFDADGGSFSGEGSVQTRKVSGGGVYGSPAGRLSSGPAAVFTGQTQGGGALKNTAASGCGHVVYVDSTPVKKRDITAGSGVPLVGPGVEVPKQPEVVSVRM
ncbi:MAG: hypothetical protein LBB48_01100 [Treponema sp.]|jgi:hypothetical protein|nr:hypothetical protein [Treponema sp.]